jgi:hypothetical protein
VHHGYAEIELRDFCKGVWGLLQRRWSYFGGDTICGSSIMASEGPRKKTRRGLNQSQSKISSEMVTVPKITLPNTKTLNRYALEPISGCKFLAMTEDHGGALTTKTCAT